MPLQWQWLLLQQLKLLLQLLKQRLKLFNWLVTDANLGKKELPLSYNHTTEVTLLSVPCEH
uniref:Uncharacterized protein n=1 Tax=Rhizophora mucronata TaxID=61149 RepID=A0A2P2IJH9_RHIMU